MKLTTIIPLLILILITASCSEQIESKYDNYQIANANNFFEKGWIPNAFIYTSMTDIYLRDNLDINSCIFSYKLSEIDFKNISLKVNTSDQPFKKVPGIDLPKSWSVGYEKSAKNFYLQETDTIYIALDKNNLKVFGYYYKQ